MSELSHSIHETSPYLKFMQNVPNVFQIFQIKCLLRDLIPKFFACHAKQRSLCVVSTFITYANFGTTYRISLIDNNLVCNFAQK